MLLHLFTILINSETYWPFLLAPGYVYYMGCKGEELYRLSICEGGRGRGNGLREDLTGMANIYNTQGFNEE